MRGGGRTCGRGKGGGGADQPSFNLVPFPLHPEPLPTAPGHLQGVPGDSAQVSERAADTEGRGRGQHPPTHRVRSLLPGTTARSACALNSNFLNECSSNSSMNAL